MNWKEKLTAINVGDNVIFKRVSRGCENNTCCRECHRILNKQFKIVDINKNSEDITYYRLENEIGTSIPCIGATKDQIQKIH